MSLLGAVLAGGRSSRMGADKANIVISGKTLLNRVADTVSEVTTKVVVLGGEREGYESWPDRVGASGPLAGLASALKTMSEDRVLVLAVDNAFVSAATLRHLVALVSDLPVVPVDDDGIRQVTCAVYPRSIAAVAVDEAEAGGSIQTLLDRVSFLPVTPDVWSEWGEDGRSWFSVDTPEDIELGLLRFS
jgi:molybdopterin-guanine dinucleotide biosynthesis protein A